jgi:hypothetical protein
MNYTDLTTNIQEVCENTFTATQLAMFVQQTEQKIYSMVQPPALRKTCDGTATLNNEFLSVPDDFLYMHSLALVDGTGDYHYLVQVDANFIREAYPKRTTVGQPKYYGHFDVDSLILGPTPDANYTVRVSYGYNPPSIVTAGTTWLGDSFDTALLNGSLVEALRFMKGEPDLVQMYDKMYMEAITLLKMFADGKLRRDSYRSGQVRAPVS